MGQANLHKYASVEGQALLPGWLLGLFCRWLVGFLQHVVPMLFVCVCVDADGQMVEDVARHFWACIPADTQDKQEKVCGWAGGWLHGASGVDLSSAKQQQLHPVLAACTCSMTLGTQHRQHDAHHRPEQHRAHLQLHLWHHILPGGSRSLMQHSLTR
jgi:hypothetical protein